MHDPGFIAEALRWRRNKCLVGRCKHCPGGSRLTCLCMLNYSDNTLESHKVEKGKLTTLFMKHFEKVLKTDGLFLFQCKGSKSGSFRSTIHCS